MIESYTYKTNKENIDSIVQLMKKTNLKGKNPNNFILDVLNSEVRANRPITNYSIH